MIGSFVDVGLVLLVLGVKVTGDRFYPNKTVNL